MPKKCFVNIPEAPKIPGLRFRNYEGTADFEKMTNVLKSCHSEREGNFTTVYENRFDDLVNCELDKDVLFAEIEGEVIGYSRVTWWNEENGGRIYLSMGFLKPNWRRKGIGSVMLLYNEERLSEIAAEEEHSGPQYFECWSQDG
jgi:GNAT superfamily N-acetyltransferase